MFSRILVVCLLLCSKQTFCQTNYFDSIKLLTNSFFGKALIENDFLTVACAQYDTVFGNKICFNQFNENGNLINSKSFKLNDLTIYCSKILLKSNQYYVFGTVQNIDLTFTQFFLACFDLNFENLWSKYYGGVFFDNGLDFKSTSDNGFILSGVATNSETSPEDAYLIKTDSLGNVEWERTYGGPYRELVYSVIQDYDGGFVLSGLSNETSTSESSKFYVVKVNSNGDTLWTKKFGDENDNNVCFVNQLKDSTLLITGSSLFLNENNDYKFKGKIYKLDHNTGAIIWEKEHLFGNYTNLYHSAIELEDKSLVVSGIYSPGDENVVRGLLLKTDSIGNEIWHREYFTRTDVDQYFYGLIATNDGGFAMCGSAHDSLMQRAWVVKTDCFGYDSLHYYYKDSICSIEDCIRYAEDANFTVNSDSLEFLQNQQLVVNNTSQDASLFWDFGDGFTIENETSVTHTYLQEGSYDVQLIFNKGMCSDTTIKTIFVGAGLGLSSPSIPLQRGKLYPNPNSGSFFIENNTGETLDFKLTDAQGKLIFQQNIHSQLENIHLVLEKGIYFVTFGEQVEKMVVK
jgi:hypothetical protein